MAYPTTPGESLTAASVTTTASSGMGTTQATAAVLGTHTAVFTVASWNGASVQPTMRLVIEGNLDGTTWVPLNTATVAGNGTYVVSTNAPNGGFEKFAMANLRTSAYFQDFGAGAPTATVTAWIASIA